MVSKKTTSSADPSTVQALTPKRPGWRTWLRAVSLPLWVYGAFLLAQFIVAALSWGLVTVGVPLKLLDQTLLTTMIAVLSYGAALVLVIGLPWWLYRRRTTRQELGAPGWPEWLDIVLPPLAFVVYMITTAVVMSLATSLLPIDVTQQQALPFERTLFMLPWQRLLVFFTLVVLAPVAEELLFRGYLHGKLRAMVPVWAAVLLTAVAFGLAHAWGGPGHPLQWAVVVDTMVLGVFLSGLREYTGAIWAGIGLHMIKNGLAFYFLFINPDIIQQLKTALLPLL